MAVPTYTAGNIATAVGALLNDASLATFTFALQLPYLNMASRELKEFFALNEVPTTSETSAVIQVDKNVSSVGFSSVDPRLPDDLIDIVKVWERTRNVNPYIPMTKVNVIPHYMEGTTINSLQFYTWESQTLRFLPANANNDIKIDYIKSLFAPFTVIGDVISIVNADSFLIYRTAGLCAEFIGQNKTRADSLNNDAGLAIDRALGIGAKSSQGIMTRRRPFRAGYKNRGGS